MPDSSVVTLPLVGGGTVDIVRGVAVILADAGIGRSGEPITEIQNRRGYVWRVLGDKADIARRLGFGSGERR